MEPEVIEEEQKRRRSLRRRSVRFSDESENKNTKVETTDLNVETEKRTDDESVKESSTNNEVIQIDEEPMDCDTVEDSSSKSNNKETEKVNTVDITDDTEEQDVRCEESSQESEASSLSTDTSSHVSSPVTSARNISTPTKTSASITRSRSAKKEEKQSDSQKDSILKYLVKTPEKEPKLKNFMKAAEQLQKGSSEVKDEELSLSQQSILFSEPVLPSSNPPVVLVEDTEPFSPSKQKKFECESVHDSICETPETSPVNVLPLKNMLKSDGQHPDSLSDVKEHEVAADKVNRLPIQENVTTNSAESNIISDAEMQKVIENEPELFKTPPKPEDDKKIEDSASKILGTPVLKLQRLTKEEIVKHSPKTSTKITDLSKECAQSDHLSTPTSAIRNKKTRLQRRPSLIKMNRDTSLPRDVEIMDCEDIVPSSQGSTGDHSDISQLVTLSGLNGEANEKAVDSPVLGTDPVSPTDSLFKFSDEPTFTQLLDGNKSNKKDEKIPEIKEEQSESKQSNISLASDNSDILPLSSNDFPDDSNDTLNIKVRPRRNVRHAFIDRDKDRTSDVTPSKKRGRKKVKVEKDDAENVEQCNAGSSQSVKTDASSQESIGFAVSSEIENALSAETEVSEKTSDELKSQSLEQSAFNPLIQTFSSGETNSEEISDSSLTAQRKVKNAKRRLKTKDKTSDKILKKQSKNDIIKKAKPEIKVFTDIIEELGVKNMDSQSEIGKTESKQKKSVGKKKLSKNNENVKDGDDSDDDDLPLSSIHHADTGSDSDESENEPLLTLLKAACPDLKRNDIAQPEVESKFDRLTEVSSKEEKGQLLDSCAELFTQEVEPVTVEPVTNKSGKSRKKTVQSKRKRKKTTKSPLATRLRSGNKLNLRSKRQVKLDTCQTKRKVVTQQRKWRKFLQQDFSSNLQPSQENEGQTQEFSGMSSHNNEETVEKKTDEKDVTKSLVISTVNEVDSAKDDAVIESVISPQGIQETQTEGELKTGPMVGKSRVLLKSILKSHKGQHRLNESRKYKSLASSILQQAKSFKFTKPVPAAPSAQKPKQNTVPMSPLASRSMMIIQNSMKMRQSLGSPSSKTKMESPQSSPKAAMKSCSSPKFRPVHLAKLYSPSASPSAGILKRRRISGDTATNSPSPPYKV